MCSPSPLNSVDSMVAHFSALQKRWCRPGKEKVLIPIEQVARLRFAHLIDEIIDLSVLRKVDLMGDG